MFRVVRRSAASASLSLLAFKVHAVGKKKKGDNGPVKLDELSLYSVPSRESRFVEEPRSSLEEAIARLREAVGPYASRLEAVYSRTRPTVDVAIQQGSASCDYLWNSPPELMRRLGVVGFSALLGYLFARRSRPKRLFYPLFFMGVTSSIYYPKEALGVALFCGEKLYSWGRSAVARMQDSWKKSLEPEVEWLEEAEEGKRPLLPR